MLCWIYFDLFFLVFLLFSLCFFPLYFLPLVLFSFFPFFFVTSFDHICFNYYYISIDFEKLPPSVQAIAKDLEQTTNHCTGFIMNICLSYGSRHEIVSACQQIVEDIQQQQFTKEEITETLFGKYLLSHDLPGKSN